MKKKSEEKKVEEKKKTENEWGIEIIESVSEPKSESAADKKIVETKDTESLESLAAEFTSLQTK